MKKIYFLLLVGLSLAVGVSAQSAVESVTVLDWDGAPLGEDGMLHIGVGETKTLQLALTPVDADASTISLGMEMQDGDMEEGGPLAFHGMDITAYKAGVRNLYIYAEGKYKTYVPIEASYVASGALYPEGTTIGQVFYSLNAKGQLQFWAEELGRSKQAVSDIAYNIPNYPSGTEVPWFQLREHVKEVVLNKIDRVGDLAFNELTGIHYIKIPDNVKALGNYVFVGCSNLQTIEVERFSPADDPMITATTGTSLLIESSDGGEGRPSVVLVNYDSYDALDAYSRQDVEWSRCGTVVAAQGYIPNSPTVHYLFTQSDSLRSLQLVVEHNGWSSSPGIIKDRTEDTPPFPWDEMGWTVQDLKINDNISYIGDGAFSTLWGIEAIQFNQRKHPLDSLHWLAFSPEIAPWKFALGDPQDGPVLPPKIVGVTPENMENVLGTWYHFLQNTVLYVPDSTFIQNDEPVRAIDLYREDPIWGRVFARITDRTVSSDTIGNEKVILKWLPLENAHSYRLTIQKTGCDTCVATLDIPATGVQGLVDWDHMSPVFNPNGIVSRRAPKEDDHGGMTLVITIQEGSGTSHMTDVAVEVTGVEANTEYSYAREVTTTSGVNTDLSKTGTFTMEVSEDVENVFVSDSAVVRIYDLLGRLTGSSFESLPDGIYIISNGLTRTKIMLRR